MHRHPPLPGAKKYPAVPPNTITLTPHLPAPMKYPMSRVTQGRMGEASMASRDSVVGASPESQRRAAAQRRRPPSPTTVWARRLRLAVSPASVLTPAGDINRATFRPSAAGLSELLVSRRRRWGAGEHDALLRGLHAAGVGNWAAVRRRFLPKWRKRDVHAHAQRLLGRRALRAWVPPAGEQRGASDTGFHMHMYMSNAPNALCGPRMQRAFAAGRRTTRLTRTHAPRRAWQ